MTEDELRRELPLDDLPVAMRDLLIRIKTAVTTKDGQWPEAELTAAVHTWMLPDLLRFIEALEVHVARGAAFDWWHAIHVATRYRNEKVVGALAELYACTRIWMADLASARRRVEAAVALGRPMVPVATDIPRMQKPDV